MSSSTELKKKIVPMSPMLPSKKINREALDILEGGGDVSNLQPSVEEASSRYVILGFDLNICYLFDCNLFINNSQVKIFSYIICN